MKFIDTTALALTTYLLVGCVSLTETTHNFVPPEGYVPNEATAKIIAETVWSSIYGKDQIDSQKPFKAELIDGIWHMEGSLEKGRQGLTVIGGVAKMQISKQTGEIVRVSHSK